MNEKSGRLNYFNGVALLLTLVIALIKAAGIPDEDVPQIVSEMVRHCAKESEIMNEELAKIAYAAYGRTTDFKNYQGLPMPEWDDLPPKIKEAWVAAATALLNEFYDAVKRILS